MDNDPIAAPLPSLEPATRTVWNGTSLPWAWKRLRALL